MSDSFTSDRWTCWLATLPDRRMVNNNPAYPAPITRMRVDGCVSCTVLRLSEAGAFDLNIRILQTLLETCDDHHQNELHKGRGSREQVCDKYTSVTNLPPRPSSFVQATESTFRVCVTQHSGEQLLHKKKLSQGGLQ